MKFFAYILPESPTAKAWVRHGLRRATFAGVTFTQRQHVPTGTDDFRFESELLTPDQIAALKKHPKVVALELLTNTHVPKAAP